MKWETMETAPIDESEFLAWYGKHVFGPKFGTMVWRVDNSKEGGKFHSLTMGTQTKHATHWKYIDGPVA